MERELWPPLYRALREVGKDFLQKYVRYPPWVVAAVFLWAAVHDRPVSRACQSAHWSTTRLRPLRLPSDSTLSRRRLVRRPRRGASAAARAPGRRTGCRPAPRPGTGRRPPPGLPRPAAGTP